VEAPCGLVPVLSRAREVVGSYLRDMVARQTRCSAVVAFRDWAALRDPLMALFGSYLREMVDRSIDVLHSSVLRSHLCTVFAVDMGESRRYHLSLDVEVAPDQTQLLDLRSHHSHTDLQVIVGILHCH
jgi:phage baseplate assembly protein W